MSDRGHVGVLHADGTVTVRYVHFDAGPHYLPYAIAKIWWATFHQDTAACAAALLAHDWDHLDPTTTGDTDVWDATPVPGIGAHLDHHGGGPVTGDPTHLDLPGLYLYLFDLDRPTLLTCTEPRTPLTTTTPVLDLCHGATVEIA